MQNQNRREMFKLHVFVTEAEKVLQVDLICTFFPKHSICIKFYYSKRKFLLHWDATTEENWDRIWNTRLVIVWSLEWESLVVNLCQQFVKAEAVPEAGDNFFEHCRSYPEEF